MKRAKKIPKKCLTDSYVLDVLALYLAASEAKVPGLFACPPREEAAKETPKQGHKTH